MWAKRRFSCLDCRGEPGFQAKHIENEAGDRELEKNINVWHAKREKKVDALNRGEHSNRNKKKKKEKKNRVRSIDDCETCD